MFAIWTKRLLVLAAGLAVVAGFVWAMRDRPALVDVAVAEKGPMQVTITEEGMTRVRDVYTISSPIAGHLARTMLEVGDPVVADKTVIAAIHPLDPPLLDNRTQAELVAALGAARAALVIAEAEHSRSLAALDLAVKAMERASRLSQTGVIADAMLQKAQAEVDVARAQVASALAAINLRRAELQSAEARLRQTSDRSRADDQTCCINITAPASGVVLDVFARSEQPLAVGAKIAEVGDPKNLEIVVDLISADAVRVKPGDKAKIVDWGGDTPLAATLRRIDPAAFTKVSALGIEEQRVNAVFDLDTADPRLGQGFRVYAEIAVWNAADVLKVPLSSLFRRGNDWNLFVLADGKLAERRLEIGHMNDAAAEVLSGLSAGEVVVLHPGDTLENQMPAERRSQ